MTKNVIINRSNHRRTLSLVLCLTLLFSMFSVLIANPAEANSTRAAVVQEVTGTVHVKKAGGSKSFRAYRNMSLNQGDHITTGADSSVVLKVLDREDGIPIDQNSELYISD